MAAASSAATALRVLYEATSGQNWTNNSGWLTGEPCFGTSGCGHGIPWSAATPGLWHGICCNDTDVVVVFLTRNALTGTLPASMLTNMTSLFALGFPGGWSTPAAIQRQLSGTLPSQLGLLTNLNVFAFGTNSLSGTLPTHLGLLTNLNAHSDGLGCGTNYISGTIPTQLGLLTALPKLGLMTNALTGTVPSELGAMTKLVSLSFQQNSVSGSLPTELGRLTGLAEFQVYSNRLSGQLPWQLGTIQELGTCYLTHQQCIAQSAAWKQKLCEASETFDTSNRDLNAFECPLPAALTDFVGNNCAHAFPCPPPPMPPARPPLSPPPPPPRFPPLPLFPPSPLLAPTLPEPARFLLGTGTVIALAVSGVVILYALVSLMVCRARKRWKGEELLFELQDLGAKKPMTMQVNGEELTLHQGLMRLHAHKTSGVGSQRFRGDVSDLVLGAPREAALGVAHLLGLSQDVLARALTRGTAAIVKEIEGRGTDEDRECLDYCLRQAAGSSPLLFSNSPFPRDCDANGVRRDRINEVTGQGMRLADFENHPHARTAKLTQAHVLALRLYSTAAFKSINGPLRDHHRTGAHPLAVTVHHLNEAVKQLRTVSADRPDAHAALDLWRGLSNVRVSDEFAVQGGAERAPMSTSPDPGVAVEYSAGAPSSLLLKIATSSFIDRGADLTFVSAFPREREVLFPPLTYLQPTGQCEEVVLPSGAKFDVVECRPRFAS